MSDTNTKANLIIPHGQMVVAGEIEIRGQRGAISRAILIEFATEEDIRQAIAQRKLTFGMFGETREEVEGRWKTNRH